MFLCGHIGDNRERLSPGGFDGCRNVARFLIPARFGDDVTIETAITEMKRSSFQVTHHLKKDGALAVEGFETRVWTGRDPADPGRIRSQPIPAEVIAKLSLP